jgi:hypothetical protein
MAHRGHALTIDAGWRDVAETALEFARRFAPARQVAGVSRGLSQPTYEASEADFLRR